MHCVFGNLINMVLKKDKKIDLIGFFSDFVLIVSVRPSLA